MFGRPVDGFWAFPPSPDQKCLDEGRLTLGCGIVIAFVDLLCTCLPIPVVYRLNMARRKRLEITALLSLGFVVTGAATARCYYTWKGLIGTYDETWYANPLWIMAAVEIDLSIVSRSYLFKMPLSF